MLQSNTFFGDNLEGSSTSFSKCMALFGTTNVRHKLKENLLKGMSEMENALLLFSDIIDETCITVSAMALGNTRNCANRMSWSLTDGLADTTAPESPHSGHPLPFLVYSVAFQ